MEVIHAKNFSKFRDKVKERIKSGEVFIYPTDTIYGIGCDATNNSAVEKIREIKERTEKPFSILAPSKEWIYDNCILDIYIRDWLDKLPGPYTLILKLKNKSKVSRSVNLDSDDIGVRIPRHWFSGFVSELGFPIVTTSVNLTGEKHINSVNDVSEKMKSQINFMVDEDHIKGNPSQIVDLRDGVKIIKRG